MEMLIWMGPPVDNAVIVDVEEEDQLVHGDVDLDGPTGLCYSLLLPLHQRVPPPQAVVVDPLFFKKSLVEPP